ncbi:MAG TPA: DinB family protein [Vicinamibacterales bacterium]
MPLDTLLRETLSGLLRELVDGPSGDVAFVVNPGDQGLLGSLARLSAPDASARPGGRSSVAAHVQHLRYGFEILNRWLRGENPFADASYAASWGRQQVTDEEWRDLRNALDREVRAWMSAVTAPREWDAVTLSGAIGSVAHLAYHLGAIRQLVASASGPPAAD